jgi:trans-aconitate 2-methyltransferase
VPDWSGRDYADVSSLQRAMATEAVRALHFGAGDRVLDVGCGDGYLTRAVAGMVPDGCVVGVDASPRMIETAHSGGEATDSRPWFVVADARRLPFAEFFDAVLSFNALHWGTPAAAGAWRDRHGAAPRRTGTDPGGVCRAADQY